MPHFFVHKPAYIVTRKVNFNGLLRLFVGNN